MRLDHFLLSPNLSVGLVGLTALTEASANGKH